MIIMLLSDAHKRFLLEKQMQALSKESIRDYREFVGRFIRFYPADKEAEQLQQSDIEDYILQTVSAPLSKSTKATYIRHAKIFLKWLCLNYDCGFDYARIKVPKSTGRVVRIYSDDDVKTIFSAVQVYHGRIWMTKRDKAIISLMLDSGLRQNEVCCIKHSDFYNDYQRLIVHGKGDKYRVVPLGSFSRELVRDYIRCCPYRNEYLFCDRTGEPITKNAVKLMISKLAKKLPFELTSHKLRHNFATNWCIDQHQKHRSVDVAQLMYIMGHNDIKTTQRYLHMAMEIIAGDAPISHLDKVYTCQGGEQGGP